MKSKIVSNQIGQATMEAVLLVAVIVVIATKISSFATSNGLVASLVEGPWSPIRGMIEDGVWVRHTKSKALHPNFLERHQSREGDKT